MFLADVFWVYSLERLCSSHPVGVAFIRGPTSLVNSLCTLILWAFGKLDIEEELPILSINRSSKGSAKMSARDFKNRNDYFNFVNLVTDFANGHRCVLFMIPSFPPFWIWL